MLFVVHLSFLHAKQLLINFFFENQKTYANLLLGLTSSQLYPYSKCQPMPTGFYTRWDFDSETSRFIHRQHKTRSFENMVMFSSQRTRPVCEIDSLFTTGRQKKTDCFSVDGFCSHCNTVFEAMSCFFCPCQELRPSLTEEDIQRGSKKRVLDALRRLYMQEKGYKFFEIWECERWRLCKTTKTVKQQIREHFSYRRSLAAEQLLEEIKEGKVFDYLQCEIEGPENSRANFACFSPIFKNTLVSKNDIGDLMKTYAEEEGIMSQPRKMLISSFTLQNGTLITPLLLFHLQLDLFITKTHRFVEYTPKNCFNSFVQAAVDARRKGDENTISSVIAETMKLLANSSYGHQIMDQSQHTVTKDLNDEKTCGH